MELSNAGRAEVLVHALPYIQKYSGKIIVIKYGGNAMVNPSLKNAVMRDIVLLSLIGIKPVLVHGGGPEISELLAQLGKKTEFIDGLRVTDAQTQQVVQMVLCGKINKSLVNLLQNNGGSAIGLSGMDGHLLEAEQLDAVHGFVGEIVRVNPKPITDLLEKGYIPVISTVGCDDEGNTYNINADTAAARIAGALGAQSLITMTDVQGLLEDKNDADTLISRVYLDEIPALTEAGILSGGMLPKVSCCAQAVELGVHRAFIIDGRVPHAILIEILTDEGMGTMFRHR